MQSSGHQWPVTNDDSVDDDDDAQIYIHNVISVGHKAYILRPFLSLTFVFSATFYAVYRLSLNVNYWTDIAAGFTLGLLFAAYLVSPLEYNLLLCHTAVIE